MRTQRGFNHAKDFCRRWSCAGHSV